MKKVLYIFMSIILLASCQKDACVQTPEEAVVTFDVQTPVEFEIKSGENGTGSKINALWYGVYHKKADGGYVYVNDMSGKTAKFTVSGQYAEIKLPVAQGIYTVNVIGDTASKTGKIFFIFHPP